MSQRSLRQPSTRRALKECERCEGYGKSSELAPCTTFDQGCGCNGPRVEVTCPDCHGFGTIEEEN